MREYDLTHARRYKSTYSNSEGGSRVEVADGAPGVIPLRDSKVQDGAVVVGTPAWTINAVGAAGL
ncbi:DUF397 domain-containing protein [Streptomyces sp. NPDC005435]|uniref:DUF397 domain-containing protein n=1 Tax=Streptomyces sp. NPDC005435 TaxID=3154464 RepID=UPI003455B6E9